MPYIALLKEFRLWLIWEALGFRVTAPIPESHIEIRRIPRSSIGLKIGFCTGFPLTWVYCCGQGFGCKVYGIVMGSLCNLVILTPGAKSEGNGHRNFRGRKCDAVRQLQDSGQNLRGWNSHAWGSLKGIIGFKAYEEPESPT